MRSKLSAPIMGPSMVFLLAAATMVLAPLQEVAAQAYKLPGAIAAEPDENFKKAWRLFHDREIGSNLTEPATEAAGLLRMRERDGPTVTEDTMHTSFAYRLLVAKMPGRFGDYPGEAPESNAALRYFDMGVRYLYRQLNIPARKEFAKGIFTAAHLDEKDYNALQAKAIEATYDKGATIETNALNLAAIFMGADLNTKEKMLSVVYRKFSGVKANNAVSDWHHPAYRLKAVYWNLGFFISTHWLVGNASNPDDEKIMQEALDMKNTKGWANTKFWRKFKYQTSNLDLL